MSAPRLLVDRRPSGSLLAFDGEPVFPLTSAAESEALSRLATLFGQQLVEVRGELLAGAHASSAVSSVDGELQPRQVIALGRELAEAARFYAHLTQRPWRQVQRVAEVPRDGSMAILVATPGDLHSDLLFELNGCSDEGEGGKSREKGVPGILTARDPSSLHRQMLLRAAASRGGTEPKERRVDIYPDLPCKVIKPLGWPVVGKRATAGQIRSALAYSAGILTLRTHSDGIDSDLGPNLVLCPLDRVPLGATGERAPRCHLTGLCHRRSMTPVPEAWTEGVLLPPEQLSARLFLWDTCNGLIQPGSANDESWGLVERFLACSSLGALVTAWTANYRSREAAFELASALDAGEPVGQALGRHLAQEQRWRLGGLCLFGDPRTRMPPSRPPTLAEVEAQQASAAMTVTPDDRSAATSSLEQNGGEIDLLYGAILAGYQEASEGSLVDELEPRGREALERIELYWSRGGWATEKRMREAVLRYLAARTPYFAHNDWWGLHRDFESTAPRRCPNCRRRTMVLRVRCQMRGVSLRRVQSCPLCGRIEDAPWASRLGLRLGQDRRLHLVGALPRHRWSAGLILHGYLAAEIAYQPWPMRPSGRPARSCEMPEECPTGSFQLSLVFLHGPSLTVLALSMSRPASVS